MEFGLIVIGDEILNGERQDRHFNFFQSLFLQLGHQLAWFQVLPDTPELLIKRLQVSMAESLPVFSCGGIGATPDDYTRACAATAAGVSLVRHPEAAKMIEDRFADAAYPHRINMADLPAGCSLIPNPYNQVPGFAIREHYFFPGFPDMAQPMGRWVLETYFQGQEQVGESDSVRVYHASESDLMPLMQCLQAQYPKLKLFSLPRLGSGGFVELGWRGQDIKQAVIELRNALDEAGFRFEVASVKKN